jgi:hypothetical protein
MFFILKVEAEVSNYRFLAQRAKNKEWVFCRFSWYYSVILISTKLVITAGPPMTILVRYEEIVIIMLFVDSVKMHTIGTQK